MIIPFWFPPDHTNSSELAMGANRAGDNLRRRQKRHKKNMEKMALAAERSKPTAKTATKH
jgi:hypothetical protein